MFEKENISNRKVFCLTVLALIFITISTLAFSQNVSSYETERTRALELIGEGKYLIALPILEKLVTIKQNDAEVWRELGISRLINSQLLKDASARKLERKRGREALVIANKLGIEDARVIKFLEDVPEDGGEDHLFSYSKNEEVHKAMVEGEEAFSKGNYEKARIAYERAYKLDPKNYAAVTFIGDCYYSIKQWDKAAEWFAKAIILEPDSELAYRYWGDSLMMQGKKKEALEKFVEAFISEPVNPLTLESLLNWAEVCKVNVNQPIQIPKYFVATNEKDENIVLIPTEDKGEGSSAWIKYGLTKLEWQPNKKGVLSQKFIKQFPGAKKYRNSLAEETEALRAVAFAVESLLKEKNIQKLSPELEKLKKLNDSGLLEAHILISAGIATGDEEVFRDYEAFLKSNRDKLRRFVIEYIVNGASCINAYI